MIDNLRSYDPEVHAEYIHDKLLPLVVNHAKDNSHPIDAAALVSFLALATILQARGFCRDELMFAIDGSRAPTHAAPEVLQ